MTRLFILMTLCGISMGEALVKRPSPIAPAETPRPTTKRHLMNTPTEGSATDTVKPSEIRALAESTSMPAPKVVPKPAEATHQGLKGEVLKVDKRRDRISISDAPNHTWSRKDTVCVQRETRTLACGKVIAVGIKGAVVQLTSHSAMVKPGDEATFIPPDSNVPQITDEQLSSEELMEERPYKFNVALGYTLSLDFFYPVAHFYWNVSPKIAIGLMPAYLSKTGDTVTDTVKGYGGQLTVNYCADGFFRGFWVHFGTGFYRLEASNGALTETLNAPVVTTLIGWREDWAHGLNVGAGLGGRFLSPLSGLITGVSYRSLYPMALVEVGFSF